MGIVGGIAMLIILASTFFLLKNHYEIFYALHIAMFMFIIIVIGLHRPSITKKSLIIVIFAGAVWFSDRLIRTSRIVFNAFGNTATLTALPLGGVRVTLKRTPCNVVPGSHVFLWIPGLRTLETHPFTVVSTEPLELVVKAHDGFTKDLLAHATKTPGAVMRASSDGPYGKLPNFMEYDQVIVIAGGSGASYAVGVACEIVRKMSENGKCVNVTFVWVVREEGMFLVYFAVFL
jgi:predicted ferric reductase